MVLVTLGNKLSVFERDLGVVLLLDQQFRSLNELDSLLVSVPGLVVLGASVDLVVELRILYHQIRLLYCVGDLLKFVHAVQLVVLDDLLDHLVQVFVQVRRDVVFQVLLLFKSAHDRLKFTMRFSNVHFKFNLKF